MKERPIMFSGPMVRAILEGRKTMTRRVVKPVGNDGGFVLLDHGNGYWPYRSDDGESSMHTVKKGNKLYQNETPHSCPYGQAGDQLWVREAFSGPHCMDASDGCKAVPPSKWGDCSRIWYWADGNPTEGDWTRPRPSIHMPRWTSRILLEVTAVRVERLNDISQRDAIAEGAPPSHPSIDRVSSEFGYQDFSRSWFGQLWESINGPGSWAANPWVWAISFRMVQP